MTTVLAPDVEPALRPLPLACRLCGAPHPPAAAADLRGVPRPARAGLRSRPAPARRGHDRRAAALALALPRVAAVRGRAHALARQRVHPARRMLPRWRAGSVSPGSGSRTTPSPIPRSPSRTGSSPPRSTPPGPWASRWWGAPPPATWPTRSPPRRRAPGLPAWIFIPRRSRARQGGRHRGVRPPTGAGARHLRRRQPALRPGGRPLRLGTRQHQPARATTARAPRPSPSRSPSSSAGGCPPRWWRRWRAARW